MCSLGLQVYALTLNSTPKANTPYRIGPRADALILTSNLTSNLTSIVFLGPYLFWIIGRSSMFIDSRVYPNNPSRLSSSPVIVVLATPFWNIPVSGFTDLWMSSIVIWVQNILLAGVFSYSYAILTQSVWYATIQISCLFSVGITVDHQCFWQQNVPASILGEKLNRKFEKTTI